MSNTYILLFSIVFLNGFERRFHKKYAIDGEPKQAGVPFQGVQCIARARNRARTADYVMKRGKPSPPVRKTTKARTKPGFLFHVSAVGRRKAGTALEEGACDFQTHVARNCRAGDDPSKIAKDFGWGRLPRNIQARFSPLEAWKAAEEPRWRDNKGVQGLSQTQRGPSDTLSRNAKAPSSGGAANIRARDAKARMYGKGR